MQKEKYKQAAQINWEIETIKQIKNHGVKLSMTIEQHDMENEFSQIKEILNQNLNAFCDERINELEKQFSEL